MLILSKNPLTPQIRCTKGLPEKSKKKSIAARGPKTQKSKGQKRKRAKG